MAGRDADIGFGRLKDAFDIAKQEYKHLNASIIPYFGYLRTQLANDLGAEGENLTFFKVRCPYDPTWDFTQVVDFDGEDWSFGLGIVLDSKTDSVIKYKIFMAADENGDPTYRVGKGGTAFRIGTDDKGLAKELTKLGLEAIRKRKIRPDEKFVIEIGF